MFCSRPVDTATSDEFLKRTGGEGIGLAFEDADLGHADAGLARRTCARCRRSRPRRATAGCRSCRRPAVHLAMGLLISSEMIAPPKPMTSAKPSSAVEVQPVGREEAVDAEQAGDDAQHRDRPSHWSGRTEGYVSS